MARGNQREESRAKNQKKKEKEQKGKTNLNGQSINQKKESDAAIMRAKQEAALAKKQADADAKNETGVSSSVALVMFDSLRNAFNKTEVNAEQERRKIVLNVYDMLQPGFITHFGYCLGIGIYHSGIEIGDHEYCFGGHDYEHVTGVFMVQPKIGPQGLLFKQSINMGYTSLTQKQVDKVLQDISKDYLGTSYKLLTRNCNHFSEDLCKRLTGKQAPRWINRAAKLGTMFPCVIPTEWVEPPDATSSKSDILGSPSSSSYSSNSPLKKPTTSLPPKVPTIKIKRLACPPSSRRPSGSESIRLVRTPVMEDDEIDCSSPVKEPDTYRPDVIRSATQLSITAPVELL